MVKKVALTLSGTRRHDTLTTLLRLKPYSATNTPQRILRHEYFLLPTPKPISRFFGQTEKACPRCVEGSHLANAPSADPPNTGAIPKSDRSEKSKCF